MNLNALGTREERRSKFTLPLPGSLPADEESTLLEAMLREEERRLLDAEQAIVLSEGRAHLKAEFKTARGNRKYGLLRIETLRVRLALLESRVARAAPGEPDLRPGGGWMPAPLEPGYVPTEQV